MLKQAAERVLSIKDLQDLDDAEMAPETKP
jgi:hypothetical protein